MRLLNKASSLILGLMIRPLMLLVQLYARFACRFRGASTTHSNEYRDFSIEGLHFREYPVDVDNFAHRVTEAGNATAAKNNTVVLMGGIPTDASETFYWLVSKLCRLNPDLRCIIVQIPFVESDTRLVLSETLKARYSGRLFPFNGEVDLSEESVDPRFDHHNQAITAERILEQLGVSQAHFVGHDRGAVVFDYLIGSNPNRALSYSRGSQLWDHYDDAWSALAPKLIVGPPHRQMVIAWQCQFLFFAVIRLKRPIGLLSPGFVASVAKASRGTESYDRKTHLLYKALAIPKQIQVIIGQTMMQTDSTDEIKSREPLLQSNVPIMQFQGEDEFAINAKGTLISDQPYFGRYNLYANDVCDLYPGSVGQDPLNKAHGLIQECGSYRSLKLKQKARLSRFCLIPNAAHFNVVENPLACAAAINDFVLDNALN